MIPPRLLLCTDLDRTLIPNGDAPESPEAIPVLTALVHRDDVQLAYVSGRDRTLVESAVRTYGLPSPDYVIGDVGTSIYTVRGSDWIVWKDWHGAIRHSWHGLSRDDLQYCLQDIDLLRIQEEEKQNRYKLSYYAPASVDAGNLLARVRSRLHALDIECNLVWSVDETRQQGLLDILPASASKYHAVDFLLQRTGCGVENTLYAGDSGNDVDVLSSPIRSVLVANATAKVRRQARQLALQRRHGNDLYLAKGGYMNMNGNYAAGILEGVMHYYPDLLIDAGMSGTSG